MQHVKGGEVLSSIAYLNRTPMPASPISAVTEEAKQALTSDYVVERIRQDFPALHQQVKTVL